MLKEKVAQLLDAAFAENQSLFLIDLTVDASQTIKVVIDGDHGVSVKDCIAISRAVEHQLDRDTYDFSLEVTSAGLSSPLVLPRQFTKNVGRTLAVTTNTEEKIEGELTQVTDTGIKLVWKAREPKPVGKGKITVEKQAVLPFTDITEAKVKIKFN